jgi:predicted TIM-barrel fold metal-dependent hydrolase
MDERLNWLISVDDHVIEPAGVWQDRVPAKFKGAAPHIVRDDQGEAWIYEGKRFATIGLSAAAGREKEEFSPTPVTYEQMRPGCYDAAARIEDMDRDGVLASLCFPSFPRFCGQTFYEARDHELGLLCVKAYNDWMIDEWAGAAPGRFIPGIILPLWDPVEGAREIERSAAKGAKAVIFSENPAMLGLPSIHDKARYWDPVFAAASESGLPICIHIGSSSKVPTTSADNPLIITLALTPMNAMITCVDWLFSGNLERHPNLKICLSEGGIGWIPYVLERCDYTLDRQGYWASKGDFSLDLAGGKVEARDTKPSSARSSVPSELFRERMFGCFIDDIHGIDCLDLIGIDNVMIETDYPHTDSSWPNSIETAHKRLDSRNDDEKYQILQGNAIRVFDFEPAPIPSEVAQPTAGGLR